MILPVHSSCSGNLTEGELTNDQMLQLASGKRTAYLEFTSKKGKPYEASLKLDDNYRIDMKFRDNRPKVIRRTFHKAFS